MNRNSLPIIKFLNLERVAKKNRLDKRGKIVHTKPMLTTHNICEVIWDGDNFVSEISESDLISESLLTIK